MLYRKALFIFLNLLLLFFISCSKNNKDDYNQILWFGYPAEYWNSQSLHLGNGYIGASFFGGIEEEKIALTEKSMWTGRPFRRELCKSIPDMVLDKAYGWKPGQ